MELCRSGAGHKDTNFYEANTNFDIIALVNFYSFLASNIFLEHHIIIWKMKLSSGNRKLLNIILKLPFNNFFFAINVSDTPRLTSHWLSSSFTISAKEVSAKQKQAKN